MPNLPGPDTDVLVPLASKRPIGDIHTHLEKYPGFNGIVRRGDRTFAVFSVMPSDAILKAVKGTK